MSNLILSYNNKILQPEDGMVYSYFSGYPPNPYLIYKAQDAVVVNGKVAQLIDIVNNNNAAQNTESLRPNYGTDLAIPYIGFTGAQELYGSVPTLTQPFTICASVIYHNDISGYIFDGNPRVIFGHNTGYLAHAGASIIGPYPETNKVLSHVQIYNGSQSKIIVDGVTLTSGNAGSNYLGVFTIGRRHSSLLDRLDGKVFEIFIYNRALSSSEINSMNSYFSKNDIL